MRNQKNRTYTLEEYKTVNEVMSELRKVNPNGNYKDLMFLLGNNGTNDQVGWIIDTLKEYDTLYNLGKVECCYFFINQLLAVKQYRKKCRQILKEMKEEGEKKSGD